MIAPVLVLASGIGFRWFFSFGRDVHLNADVMDCLFEREVVADHAIEA
jgi:hypothetical protein